jgi:CHAD domain-containing protein
MVARTNASELLIRQRLAAVTQALPAARVGDVTAIHAARVATRRLREALPLVATGSSGRKLGRIVRRLTRALGPVRELDVANLMLDELSPGRERPRPGVARLQQVVREERQRLHRDMVRSIERCDVDKLTRKAIAVARKHDQEMAGKQRQRDPHRIQVARDRAARRAQRLHAAIENAASIYLPDRLHDVRIAVKKLRYAVEIAQDLSRSRATVRLAALKRAQDLLGRMHDLEVLIARTRAVQGSPTASSLRLSADLDEVVRRLETECRQLHGHYIAERRTLLAIGDHVIALANARPRRTRAA